MTARENLKLRNKKNSQNPENSNILEQLSKPVDASRSYSPCTSSPQTSSSEFSPSCDPFGLEGEKGESEDEYSVMKNSYVGAKTIQNSDDEIDIDDSNSEIDDTVEAMIEKRNEGKGFSDRNGNSTHTMNIRTDEKGKKGAKCGDDGENDEKCKSGEKLGGEVDTRIGWLAHRRWLPTTIRDVLVALTE